MWNMRRRESTVCLLYCNYQQIQYIKIIEMKPAVLEQMSEPAQAFPPPAFQSPEFTKFYAFHKYLEVYTTAFHFHHQIKMIKKKHTDILSRIKNLETHLERNEPHPPESSSSEKPKRKRRLAQQIQRNFVCNEQKCQKNYGTLGSLQQHMRLKHPQKFKQDIESEQYYPKLGEPWLKKQEQPSVQKLQ